MRTEEIKITAADRARQLAREAGAAFGQQLVEEERQALDHELPFSRGEVAEELRSMATADDDPASIPAEIRAALGDEAALAEFSAGCSEVLILAALALEAEERAALAAAQEAEERAERELASHPAVLAFETELAAAYEEDERHA